MILNLFCVTSNLLCSTWRYNIIHNILKLNKMRLWNTNTPYNDICRDFLIIIKRAFILHMRIFLVTRYLYWYVHQNSWSKRSNVTVKRLIPTEISVHQKHLNSSTNCWKLLTKFSFSKSWPNHKGQGHRVNHVGTHRNVMS